MFARAEVGSGSDIHAGSFALIPNGSYALDKAYHRDELCFHEGKMSLKANLILKVICGLAIILLSSCNSVDEHRQPELSPDSENCDAPPVPTQTCDFRLKRVYGYDFVYDVETGVYAVVGVPECYYCDGFFYSLFGDGWEISLHPNGRYRPVALGLLPRGLQKKVYAKMYARILTNAQLQGGTFAKSPL